MDHAEALRLQAAEKYALGELSGELRDQYEEHYFACSECALDIQATAMFLEGTRQLATQERSMPALLPQPASSTWFGRFFGSWLRPAVAVPLLATLLAAVIYQNAVTIPGLKSSAARTFAPQVYGPAFSLLTANVRGGSGVEIAVRPNESFLLDFDFTPSATFGSYVAQLQHTSGRVLLRTNLAGGQANRSLHFAVPAGTLSRPGQYALVFYGATPNGAPAAEVQRLSFTVAFPR